MADIMTERGTRDRNRIDVHQEWECRYWSKKFGVRLKELKRAVRQVGDRVADVERYFATREEGTTVSGDHPVAPSALNPE